MVSLRWSLATSLTHRNSKITVFRDRGAVGELEISCEMVLTFSYKTNKVQSPNV